jgi:hypothetical protein
MKVCDHIQNVNRTDTVGPGRRGRPEPQDCAVEVSGNEDVAILNDIDGFNWVARISMVTVWLPSGPRPGGRLARRDLVLPSIRSAPMLSLWELHAVWMSYRTPH